MTDYLDALLEDQEREEMEEALGIGLTAAGGPYRRRNLGAEAEAAVDALARSGGASWESGREPEEGGEPSEETGRWSEEWILEPLAEKKVPGGADGAGMGPRSRSWDGAERPESGSIAAESGAVLPLMRGEAAQDGAPAVRPVVPELPEADGREVPAWLAGEAGIAGRRMAEAGSAGAGGGREEQGGAGWLYHSLRAGAAAAGYMLRGGETVTVVEKAGGSPGGGLSPAELDRMLERDARRYDGGFSLF